MIVTIDAGSATAPYQQIVEQVVAAIGAGQLVAGVKLPTVRQFASDLGLAVNTVAKAYKQLEAEGHVETRGRSGTVVRGRAGEGHVSEVEDAAHAFALTARRGGLELDEAIGVLRRAW